MRKSPTGGQPQTAAFAEQRPLVFAALCALTGALAGTLVQFVPLLYVVALALSAAFALLLIKLRRSVYGAAMLFTFFFFALSAGAAAHPKLPPQGDYGVYAIIDDVKTDEMGHVRVSLRDVTLYSGEGGKAFCKGAYWSFYLKEGESADLPLGHGVSFHASLYEPSVQMNPYGFDFRMSLLTKGIEIGLYGAEDVAVSQEIKWDFRTAALLAREAISSRLDALLGEHSVLAKALLLGEREDMPDEMNEAFARAGIAHVLAVSGLHVGLLSGALLLILKRLVKPRVRAYLISGFLALYCLLLGFSPGVTRASVLTAAMMFTLAGGRRADALSALSLSMLIVLLLRPLDTFTYGFQLSFSAALAIVLLYTPFQKLLSFIHIRKAREAFATTFAATAGTLVPASLLFHRFSLIGLLVSPAVCAAVGLLLPALMILLLVSCVSPSLAGLAAAPFRMILSALEDVCLWLGSLSFASVRVPSLPFPLAVFLIAAVVMLSPYCALIKKNRRRALAAMFAFAVAAHLLMIDHGLTYTQLTMGNADSAVILDDRATTVVDLGENASDLTRMLLSTGRNIDTLILTHLHEDHMLGLRQVLDEEIKVGCLILPQGAEEAAISENSRALIAELAAAGTPISHVSAGDAFSPSERVVMIVLWPVQGAAHEGGEANDYSLAINASLDDAIFCLTGDLSGKYDRYAAQKCDVLKVSHHGGSNETTVAFLAAAKPAVALVSAKGTALGSPKAAVIERLNEVGAKLYVTGDSGAVQIRVDQDQIQVKTYLGSEEKE